MGDHDGDEPDCNDNSQPRSLRKTLNWNDHITRAVFNAVDGPVTYFREKVVLPMQARNKEKFYHRRFNRVPTVDQCDFQDPVCVYEANEQYYRDKKVETNIIKILRQRKLECFAWEGPDAEVKCRKFVDVYEDAATNWFIKYGDMRTHKGAIEAYMKQKHRLIWERRHPDRKLH